MMIRANGKTLRYSDDADVRETYLLSFFKNCGQQSLIDAIFKAARSQINKKRLKLEPILELTSMSIELHKMAFKI